MPESNDAEFPTPSGRGVRTVDQLIADIKRLGIQAQTFRMRAEEIEAQRLDIETQLTGVEHTS